MFSYQNIDSPLSFLSLTLLYSRRNSSYSLYYMILVYIYITHPTMSLMAAYISTEAMYDFCLMLYNLQVFRFKVFKIEVIKIKISRFQMKSIGNNIVKTQFFCKRKSNQIIIRGKYCVH